MFQYMVVLLVVLTKLTLCLPTGSPGCDYSPASSFAHGVFPQDEEDSPSNVVVSKMRVNGWISVNLTDTEDYFRGFIVRTRHSGQFVETEGGEYKKLNCEGECTALDVRVGK